MKSRKSVLAIVATAVLGISLVLSSCSSGSSSDTTVAAAETPSDSMATNDADSSMSDTEAGSDMASSDPYCLNAAPLKALNLKSITSDTAGGAAMALDSVMGEFPASLQESAASMQQFLMDAAVSASAKDGSSHQATLTEVLKWFDDRC